MLVWRVIDNAGGIARLLARQMFGSDAAPVVVGGSTLVAIGWLLALRRGPTLLEWLTLAHLGGVCLLVSFVPRHALVLVPLVSLYALLALTRAVARVQARLRGTAARRAVALVPVLAFAGGLGINLTRMPDALTPSPGQVERRQRYEAAGAWLRENTAPDAVILCRGAPIFSYLSGRTAYTSRFVRERRLIARTGADVVLGDGPLRKQVAHRLRRESWRELTIPGADMRVWLRPERER